MVTQDRNCLQLCVATGESARVKRAVAKWSSWKRRGHRSTTTCAISAIRRRCKVVAQFRTVVERRTSRYPLLYVACKGLASRPGSSRRTAADETSTYGSTRMRVLWSTLGLYVAEGAAGVWR